MADNVSASELVNAEIVETAASEDFVVINQEKAIKQITLGQLMAKVVDMIPTENNEFPDSLNLDSLLKAITYKLFHLTTAEIGWEGEINMEYGNLKDLLIFILNKLNSYENGIKSEDIVFTVGGETPDHASSLEGSSVEEVLNYILNNYRFSDYNIPSDEVYTNINTWDSDDRPESTSESGYISTQKAITTLYNLIKTKGDKSKKIYASNNEIINIEPLTSTSVAELSIRAIANTMLDIVTCLTVTCNIPGVLTTVLYRNDEEIDRFEDALTTGSHTINQFTYTSLSVDEGLSNKAYLISTMTYFEPDINTDDVDIAAYIGIGKLRALYEGNDISYDAEIVEEV